ncbi:hypothetical protein Q3G72_010699 [Acer saccharum]|nr:hypothetical protein Q3G72_010699 [Acer saccharum]
MMAYAARRLMGLVPTLLCIVVISFLIIRLAPGSPFAQEKAMAPEVRAALEARYGLDKPVLVQLARYIGQLCVGDLGMSTKYPQRAVSEMIADGLPSTLGLGFLSLVWALSLGVGTGLLGALYKDRLIDHIGMGISLIGLGVPTFVLGPFLVEVFALQWGILPAAGFGHIKHLILPALTLGTVYAAAIARLTRSGILDVVGADYVRTARAKGLRPFTLVTRHIMRGGMLPVVSYLGPAIANILVGSVVVEKMFNLPGIGPYFVDAAFNRDYFLVMGIVVLESVLLLVMNLLVDLAYGLLDPRIRYD